MGKRVKSIALSVLMAVFGACALTGPVFAAPNPNLDTPTATDTTPSENNTNLDTPSATTNPNLDTPTETDRPNTDDDTDDTETSNEAQVSKSCSEQVGSLSWIVCPGTGLLGTIIDGAYGFLTALMQVNPLPTDSETPMYIVWDYFKNLTNAIFIIFFIIVILSQLTGIGINNYGIKKVLPRIIIAAILVNLSYIICTLAVDLSNILGNGLRGVFEHIEEVAVQNGSISEMAQNLNASSIIAGVVGVGTATAGVGAALITFGGIEGAFWMLLPIILSGVFAVAAALITMAARQSLVFILAMISPLALVAYMLPNTEKWFEKWYKLFFRMLIFYPMFSVLYGASSLASLVIITSSISDNSTVNSLSVILGLAVRILPLFASIPLMRMSGTVLDKVSSAFNRISNPVSSAVGAYAGSKQALAKQRQLGAVNPKAPSTRLAQYLARRKAIRASDQKGLEDLSADRLQTAVMQSRYDRKGRLNRRGKLYYQNAQIKLQNAAVRQQIDNDFEEGFSDNGTDKRVKTSDLGFMRNVNVKYKDAVIADHIAKTRKLTVQRDNEVKRANDIRAALQDDASLSPENLRIRQQVLDGFNIDKVKLNAALEKQRIIDNDLEHKRTPSITLTEAEKRIIDAHNEGRNFVLAGAIATKRKTDSVMQSTMYELLDDTTAGDKPQKALIQSFKTKDYNTMKSAIAIMSKRGDHKDIEDVMKDYSKLIVDDKDPANIRFQKELNDTALSMKSDNLDMWSWAKGNMIRRAKHDIAVERGKTVNLAGFADFATFIAGKQMAGDTIITKEDDEHYKKLSEMNHEDRERLFEANAAEKAFYDKMASAKKDIDMVDGRSIMEHIRDNKILGDNDRTVFNARLKYGQDNLVPIDRYYMTWEKSFRDSICSGKMDGEQLESFNNYYTMGFGTANDSLFYKACNDGNENHKNNYDIVYEHMKKFFADMSTTQLSTFKTGSLDKFNKTLNEIQRLRLMRDENKSAEEAEKAMLEKTTLVKYENEKGEIKEVYVNNELKQWLETQRQALCKHSAVGMRSNMAPLAKAMLEIMDLPDKN